MLEMPFVLYINCIGSYFYSIFQTVTPEGNINALLYYLSYGKLQYKKLVLEDVREKYADNPWGYQPVVIVDDVGQELGINMAFLNYLADIHHINVKVVDFIKDNFNLKKYYLAKVRKQNYCICSVDEYYLPSSERFYRKMHNKHYLLVKNFNYDFSIFEIIDSEKNKVVEIEYQDLENAICKSIYKKKEMYLVDFEEYIDTTDFSCILKRCLRNVNSAEYIQKLRQDIERVSQNCFWNSGYYYKGYYNNISSKIIPYVCMSQSVLEKVNNSLAKKVQIIYRKWISLRNFMRFKIYRQEYSFGPILEKLNQIECIQSELYNK